jgi:hypothetical protein
MTLRRGLAWLAFLVVLELVARAVVYGMAPTAGVASRELGGKLGGPGFVAVLLVAVGLALVLTVALVWLATMGVRERWALSDRPREGAPPRIAAGPLAVRALVLTLVGWLTFAAIETLLHLHEGLGFHGVECLVGPVHRNALPVVAALALLASAAVEVARMVLAWTRRSMGRLVRPRAAGRPSCATATSRFASAPRRAPLLRGTPVRGPPAVAA